MLLGAVLIRLRENDFLGKNQFEGKTSSVENWML